MKLLSDHAVVEDEDNLKKCVWNVCHCVMNVWITQVSKTPEKYLLALNSFPENASLQEQRFHTVFRQKRADNNPKISMANKKKVWKCHIIVTLSVWYLQNLTILMMRAAFRPPSSHLFSFLFTPRIRNIQQRNGEDELSEKHIDCERKPKIPFSQLHQSIYC